MLRHTQLRQPFRAFDDFERLFGMLQERPTTSDTPRFWVSQNEDQLTIDVLVPGIQPNDIELTATTDTLRLRGQRVVDPPQDAKVVHRERPRIQLDKTWKLGKNIDADGVSASFKDGRLTIVVPFAAEAQPKRITVSS